MAMSRLTSADHPPQDEHTGKGYNVQLVMMEGLEHYRCPLCKLLLKEPLQSSCGDRFCKGCLAVFFRSTPTPLCPVDSVPISMEEMFRDVFAEREILSLHVYCSSKRLRQGCDWSGELRKLAEHEGGCLFVEVRCRQCSAEVLRKELPWHERNTCPRRMIKCKLCEFTTTAELMKDHQRNDCLEVKILCPNGCDLPAMARKEVQEHLLTCPLQVVSCFYVQVGCQFKGPRSELPSHHTANTDFHLQATFRNLQESQAQVATLTRKCSNLEEAVSSLFDKLDRFLPTFNAVEKPLSQADPARSYKEGEESSCMGGATRSSSLLGANTPVGFESTLSSFTDRLVSVERSFALHDVQLSELNIRQDLEELKTTNGTLLWKIGDFTRRLAEAVSGKTPSIYSPPFFTSPCGYKLCARLYPNGDGVGRGTHLSFFFVVMRGEYDGLLPWPFQQKVSLCLLDQNQVNPRHVVETFRPDPNSASFKRPQGDTNVASGCPLFLPHSSLRGSYCHEDTVFLKITVHSAHTIGPDVT